MNKYIDRGVFLFVLIGCSVEETVTIREFVKKQETTSSSIAFIGSYSTSSTLPFVNFLKNDLKIPEELQNNAFLDHIKNAEAVAKIVREGNVRSVFTTGDNNYKYGCERDIDNNIGRLYSDYIGDYKGNYGTGATVNEFFPALGNHDVLVHEAWLIKNDLPIKLDARLHASSGHLFSRKDWFERINKYIDSDDSTNELLDRLIDNNKLEEKTVTLSDDSKGVSYIPTASIILNNFTQQQQVLLKEVFIKSIYGDHTPSAEAKKLDELADYILFSIFNNYCVLEENTGPDFPYISYFTLPGNERYYKVGKAHAGVEVDFFILNLNSTFNSKTAHEPDGNTPGSVQHEWFVSEIKKSSADFKIVIVHDDIYTSFESEGVFSNWNLEKYADMILSGDVQAYERLFVETDHGSAYFLSVGVGGIPLNGKLPDTTHAGSQKIVLEYGALFMEFGADQLNFKFKNKEGEVKDSFSLKKGN